MNVGKAKSNLHNAWYSFRLYPIYVICRSFLMGGMVVYALIRKKNNSTNCQFCI